MSQTGSEDLVKLPTALKESKFLAYEVSPNIRASAQIETPSKEASDRFIVRRLPIP